MSFKKIQRFWYVRVRRQTRTCSCGLIWTDYDSTCPVCTSWCVHCTVLARRRTEDGSCTGSRWEKCGSCV